MIDTNVHTVQIILIKFVVFMNIHHFHLGFFERIVIIIKTLPEGYLMFKQNKLNHNTSWKY